MSKTPPENAHKPSRKRTLEDVMSSLQDLVNNELSDAKLASRMPGTRSRDSGLHNDIPENTAPDAPQAGDAIADEAPTDPGRDPNTRDMFDQDNPFCDLEAALVRRGTLTKDELAQAAEPEISTPNPPGRWPADNAVHDEVNNADNPDEAGTLEDETIVASIEAAVEAALGQSATSGTMPQIADSGTGNTTPAPDSGQARAPAAAPTERKTSEPGKAATDQLEIDWEDDIPVLHEVAAPPPKAPWLPAAVDAEPLPSDDRARDIAIRVIARLNIELRDRGQPGLDPMLINRLQRVLREELAQHAPNMDNSVDDQPDN